MDDIPAKAMCLGGCASLALLVGGILLGNSFSTVRPEEIAIAYNNIGLSIKEDRVYTSGRFHLGLGRKFIPFPKTIQTIEFSQTLGADRARLGVWSKDGQSLQISCSFMFQLIPEKTIDIYRKFGADVAKEPWKPVYMQFAQSVIKETTVQFNTLEFFTNRTDIAELIFSQLRQQLWEYFGELKYFQLRTITIPPAFENSVIKKVKEKQLVKKQEYTEQANLVKAATLKIKADGEANKTLIMRSASATANLIKQEAEAKGRRMRVEGQAQAYEDVKRTLNFNNADLLYFKYLRTLRERKDTSLLIDTAASGLIINSNKAPTG